MNALHQRNSESQHRSSIKRESNRSESSYVLDSVPLDESMRKKGKGKEETHESESPLKRKA